MHKEKARWEQHKNAACCLVQILEATNHKSATVRPPASHLTTTRDEQNNWDTVGDAKSNTLATFSYQLLHLHEPMLAD